MKSRRSNVISVERSSGERGQASVMVLLMLSLFLLAVLAFAVDYTNIWFQRQQAQTAADAACQAGAMDMYQIGQPASTMPNMGFVLGTAGDCNAYSSGGPTMCWYANKNGFNGYTGGSADVSWTFPASVTGVTAPPSLGCPVSVHAGEGLAAGEDLFQHAADGKPDANRGSALDLRLTQMMQGAPIMILNPTVSGALSYSAAELRSPSWEGHRAASSSTPAVRRRCCADPAA